MILNSKSIAHLLVLERCRIANILISFDLYGDVVGMLVDRVGQWK